MKTLNLPYHLLILLFGAGGFVSPWFLGICGCLVFENCLLRFLESRQEKVAYELEHLRADNHKLKVQNSFKSRGG